MKEEINKDRLSVWRYQLWRHWKIVITGGEWVTLLYFIKLHDATQFLRGEWEQDYRLKG